MFHTNYPRGTCRFPAALATLLCLPGIVTIIGIPADGQVPPGLPAKSQQQMELGSGDQDADIEKLRQELRHVLLDQLQKQQEKSAAPQSKKNARGAGKTSGARQSPGTLEDRLQQRAREIGERIRERVFAELYRLIDAKLGPPLPSESETIQLDATDKRGTIFQVPVTVRMRPLRLLTDPATAEQTASILDVGEIAVTLYDNLPDPVKPMDDEGFWRMYAADDAEAIKSEAKLLVSFKGGEWREPNSTHAVANVVAVRGLDLDLGLKPNGNKTYDDTMYVIVDAPSKNTEVYEFRMTTESSSTNRGVGRLDSKQVTYVRGLHRGKDPAYRLRDDSAPGTRSGIEGTVAILGANIHSAYAKRAIDSATPLAPNVSLGCQVIASSKKAFEQALIQQLDKKGIKEFPYTIIDGDELLVFERALERKAKRSVLAYGIARDAAGAANATVPK